MSRKLLSLSAAVAAAILLPTTANAYEIIGKQLEIYGKAHVSMDFVDNDTDSEVALASNSSRLGFKGVTPLTDNLNAIYQIESKIIFDEGGDNFAGRNTFVGLGGDFGKVTFGNQDTPTKDVRGVFDMFGDSVGDARNVVGQAHRRAKNSIKYSTPSFSGFGVNAMYSTAFEDAETGEGIEDNDFSLYSVALGYEGEAIELGLGYESTSDDDTTKETDTLRAAAAYNFGAIKVGAIYDNYEVDSEDQDSWGVNGAYKFGANTLKLQYLIADDISNVDDSGATQLTVGIDHKLAKSLTLYGYYNMLDNDDNTSKYRIKGGHDTDVYEVAAAGDDINVFSLGMVYSF